MPALTQLRRVSEKSDLVGNSLNRGNGTAYLLALGASAFSQPTAAIESLLLFCTLRFRTGSAGERGARSAGLEPATF
jgi:hypothetical protein